MNDEPRSSSEGEKDYRSQIIGTSEWGEEMMELAYHEIDSLCSGLELSESNVQVSKAIYNRSLDEKLIEWRSISEVASASVLVSCRVQNTCIPTNDIVEYSDVTKNDLNNCFAELKKSLELEVGPVSPKDYLEHYVHKLERSDKVAAKAEELLDACIEDGDHSGKSPSTYAASAVYCSSLLTNEKLTQQEVANAAGVDVKTIRSHYQDQINTIGITD